MNNIKEIRRIGISEMRSLAINENWFTLADIEIYSKWFDLSETENLTTNVIIEMAKMVLEYSIIDEQLEIDSICYLIAKKSDTFFSIL